MKSVSLTEEVSQVESQIRRAFHAWNERQYPRIAQMYRERFAVTLPSYLALGRAMGRAGKVNALGADAQVRRAEEKMVSLFGLGNTRPEWFMTLTGRLLPLVARQDATTSGFSGSGYLRPGYGQ
jgi:hypothetical protein